MAKALVLICLFCATAGASIVEDLNAQGWTFLYELQQGSVVRSHCQAGASAELKRETCNRAGTAVPEAFFLAEIRNAFAARAAESEARDRSLAREKDSLATEQQTVRVEIEKLEREVPKPLARLRELAGAFTRAEQRLDAIERERKTLAIERDAADGIVSGRLLRDAVLHAFSASRPGPGSLAVEKLAAAFDSAALVAVRPAPTPAPLPTPPPSRRITESWWDSLTGRLWYFDPRPRSFAEARTACPNGYGLVTAAGYTQEMLSALARLREAWDQGRTGYSRRPEDFWGYEVPPQVSGVRVATAYWFRPWHTIPIHQDYLTGRHSVMCISRNAVPR